MSGYLRNACTAAGAGLVCLLLLWPYAPELFQYIPYAAFAPANSVWPQLAHTGTFAVHSWLLTGSLELLLGMALATAFCIPALLPEGNSRAGAVSGGVAVGAILIFAGLDPVIFGSLISFCLFVSGIRLWILRPLVCAYPLAFLLVALGVLACSALATLLFLLALIYVHSTLTEFDRVELSASRFAGLLILLLPVVLGAWLTPLPFFPEYPAGQNHVPLATAFGPVQPVDRDFIRGVWGRFTLLLVLYLPLAGWQLFRRPSNGRLFFLLSILFLCLLVDTRLPETISQSGPIAGISRLLPGLYFIPLTPVLASLLLCLFATVTARSRWTAGLVALYAIAVPFLVSRSLDSTMPLPSVRTQGMHLPTGCRTSPVAASPSLALLRNPSLSYLCDSGPLRVVTITEKQVQLSSSAEKRPGRLQRITDGNERTRWRAGRKQQGNEWLQIALQEPRRIAGLALTRYHWPHHSPTALEVLVGRTCESLTVVYDSHTAEMPLHFTSDGYPFISADLARTTAHWQPQSIACIRIRQTGEAPHPWAVAGLLLYMTDQPLALFLPEQTTETGNPPPVPLPPDHASPAQLRK